MKFYELTDPIYSTDYEAEDNNPIKIIHNFRVPSIICENCGQWGSSDRIRKDIHFTNIARSIIEKKVLNLKEWKEKISILSNETSIPYNDITPSLEIGIPRGETNKDDKLNDFLHVFPGIIWVKSNIANKIISRGYSGIEFIKVDINYKNSNKCNIEFMEMIITGKGWRKGSNLEKITVCNICGRKFFPDPDFMVIDEKKWDGTDFFTVDLNPNIIFITERVFEFFGKEKFNNYRCVELKS